MRVYRQDAHIVSLVVWAVLCAVAACVLFYHSAHIVGRALFWTEVLGGAALLVFGPIGFILYLIRARLVWVRVDRERGVVVSDKYTIPWEEIEEIRRTRPRLRKKSGPAEMGKMPDVGDVGDGCSGCGTIDGEGIAIVLAIIVILVALVALIWLIFVVFIPLILVPVLEVFAPFGDRIKIVAKGRKLFLRDLRGADQFVEEVGTKARISVR